MQKRGKPCGSTHTHAHTHLFNRWKGKKNKYKFDDGDYTQCRINISTTHNLRHFILE